MSLVDFKNKFNGGTRKNRFYIDGTFPGGSFTKFHVVSTAIPPVGMDAIEYQHFGRVWKYPGEKTYTNNWSFTVIDDYQQGNNTVNLWRAFQSWHNLINDHDTNISKLISTTSTYKADDITIYHLGINGETSVGAVAKPLKKFVLNGCWPSSIKPLGFNMGTSEFGNFTVTLTWDSLEIGAVTASQSGGAGIGLNF